MSDFFSRWDSVIFLGYSVWVVIGGVVALTLNKDVGVGMMFGPLMLGLLCSAYGSIARDARRQIRENKEQS